MDNRLARDVIDEVCQFPAFAQGREKLLELVEAFEFTYVPKAVNSFGGCWQKEYKISKFRIGVTRLLMRLSDPRRTTIQGRKFEEKLTALEKLRKELFVMGPVVQQ
jgi:hypothetical protein